MVSGSNDNVWHFLQESRTDTCISDYSEIFQAFRALWSHERFLNVAEQLLGTPEIQGHPVWNLRTKTPKCEATTVPWHQGILVNVKYIYMSKLIIIS